MVVAFNRSPLPVSSLPLFLLSLSLSRNDLSLSLSRNDLSRNDLSAVCGLIGSLQAMEVLKLASDYHKEDVLSGKMLIIDAFRSSFRNGTVIFNSSYVITWIERNKLHRTDAAMIVLM